MMKAGWTADHFFFFFFLEGAIDEVLISLIFKAYDKIWKIVFIVNW